MSALLSRTIRTSTSTLASSLLVLMAMVFPASGFAGEWRVAPIRVDLDANSRSAVISVVNEGTNRFQVQMKAFEWTQDAEGKDQYTETSDIIFFPKFMQFAKPEERIIRTGIKSPATTKEKTYRLFIEEIPEPQKGDSTRIAIAIRFGVPIFVKPLKEEAKGEIHSLAVNKGTLNIGVRNSGNVHFTVDGITVSGRSGKGEEVFSKKIDGWYVLAGASKTYSTALSPEECAAAASVDIRVKTNRFNLDSKLDVSKTMCGQ